MPYLSRRPCTALSALVEHIGLQESDAFCSSDPNTRILPTGTIDLVLHYGDRFLQFAEEGARQEPVAYVTGQRLRPIEVAATGKTGIVVVGLFPWSAPALLRCNAVELQGRTCDLDYFLPRPAIRSVIEKISEAGSSDARLSIVEDFLQQQMSGHEDSLARFVTWQLQSDPSVKAGTVAAALGISKRQLDRRFRQAVGITPKQFSRVMRFQRAVRALGHGVSPAHTAQDAGYFDQSHMNHEFAEFAETTPDRLFRDRVPTPLMTSFNGRVSAFYNTLYLN